MKLSKKKKKTLLTSRLSGLGLCHVTKSYPGLSLADPGYLGYLGPSICRVSGIESFAEPARVAPEINWAPIRCTPYPDRLPRLPVTAKVREGVLGIPRKSLEVISPILPTSSTVAQQNSNHTMDFLCGADSTYENQEDDVRSANQTSNYPPSMEDSIENFFVRLSSAPADLFVPSKTSEEVEDSMIFELHAEPIRRSHSTGTDPASHYHGKSHAPSFTEGLLDAFAELTKETPKVCRYVHHPLSCHFLENKDGHSNMVD